MITFEEILRQTFRHFNRLMVDLWRLGLGSWVNLWPSVGGQIMVIVHTGRKSGLKRYAPVNYAVVDGELYCTAGFGSGSDWYRNVMANPQVEVWLPNGWWTGTVEDVSRSDRRLALLRRVLIGSGIAARMVGLHPVKMTDSELASATARYPLIRIHRVEARTGPGGPGDLAWVWPVTVLALLPLVWWRRGRK